MDLAQLATKKNFLSALEEKEKDYQEECSLPGGVRCLPFSLKPGQ